MNKSDVVQALVLSGHAPDLHQAEGALDRVLDVISKALSNGEAVSIRNFGKFETRPRAAVIRRNPTSGKTMNVPARIGIGFVPAQNLKERINMQLLGAVSAL